MHKILIIGLIAVVAYYLFAKSPQTASGLSRGFAPGPDTPKITPGMQKPGYVYSVSLLGEKKYN